MSVTVLWPGGSSAENSACNGCGGGCRRLRRCCSCRSSSAPICSRRGRSRSSRSGSRSTRPYGQTRCITLPDGSRVWLNSGTYVFYPDRFDRERQLFVSGEVYMDVTKDPERPFRVDTRNVSIRVLGTRFNLRSYNEDKYVETSLVEGSVALGLKRDGGATILMRPGDKILVDNATNAVVRERFDCAHYISWRDGFHVFRHKTLGEIARDLERMFDVQIVIRDTSLLGEEYFATFASGWEIDELLDALNIHHTLRIRRDGRIIEIERARR